MQITVRPIIEAREELKELQAIFERTPEYTVLVTGEPPAADTAIDNLRECPRKISPKDKLNLGVLADGKLIGYGSAVIHYPETGMAFLGLLIIRKDQQGKGIGSTAYSLIEQLLKSRQDIRKIQIVVGKSNVMAFPFWKKCGFKETGVVIPYKTDKVKTEAVFLEKALP